jgi:acyl-CoA reductase-like NAD-dependent aldehyde dehydrogenase
MFPPLTHSVPLLDASHSYPYLVSINVVLPALIAGNAVILKPSPQAPLVAERLSLAFRLAGVPEHAIQVLHLSPELTMHAVQHELVDSVSFTGSVATGKAINKAVVNAKRFKDVSLEVCLYRMSY